MGLRSRVAWNQDGCNDAIVDQVDKDSPEVRSGRSSRAVVKFDLPQNGHVGRTVSRRPKRSRDSLLNGHKVRVFERVVQHV